MPARKHSKESIIQALKNLASRLGKDTLSTADIATHLGASLPLSSINSNFGSLGEALQAAGLRRVGPTEHLQIISSGNVLSDEELFRSILKVEQERGHEPGASEYSAHGEYSGAPFRDRFGKWPEVLAMYRKWKVESNPAALRKEDEASETEVTVTGKQISPVTFAKRTRPAILYGEPIDFRGFRHAPVNEMGVVYLFAMVSRELGFMIESIGSAFPDCEGKYLFDAKHRQWAAAKIEFEYRASNFKEHGHDPTQCDFIVCWINDWPDCPVDVIELSKEILKLPSR